MGVLSAVPDVVGTVGGSVALILGVVKLREVFKKPKLDVRWHWKWENGALSHAGFYFVNGTPKPAHVGHFAFRVRAPGGFSQGDSFPDGVSAEFAVGGETWQFVAPPLEIEAVFPFTVPPDGVSNLHMLRLADQNDALRTVFVSGREAVLFVDYNDRRDEFVVPAEMRLMPQEGIRYEM